MASTGWSVPNNLLPLNAIHYSLDSVHSFIRFPNRPRRKNHDLPAPHRKRNNECVRNASETTRVHRHNEVFDTDERRLTQMDAVAFFGGIIVRRGLITQIYADWTSSRVPQSGQHIRRFHHHGNP